jgi:hypothetical protein
MFKCSNDRLLDFYALNQQYSPHEELNKLSKLELKLIPVRDIFSAYKKLTKFDRTLADFIGQLEVSDSIDCSNEYLATLYGVSSLCEQAVELMESGINHQEAEAA